MNVKSFQDSGQISLGPVNVFLGPNNAGKSGVLRALRFLQDGHDGRPADIRLGTDHLEVQASIVGDGLESLIGVPTSSVKVTVSFRGQGDPFAYQSTRDDGGTSGHGPFPGTEPHNLLYQYLSKRKVSGFQESVNLAYTNSIGPDLRYLVSKVVRLANPATPAHEEYMEACRRVLGFPITEFATPNGQRAGRVVSNFDAIALEDMGEGVASLVGLIVDLCLGEEKVFLVEEPENDLHPKALKALLDIMGTKAATNQFLVTTHSNVVARHLGSLPGARLFRVDQDPSDPLATSEILDLGNNPTARIEALAELGYELYDFDLFDGFLILEESSAERIIRDYLVSWFVPRLTRVRTIAAGGTSKVSPTFEDFHRLFLFTHLEGRYRNRAYVLADGDDAGIEVVTRLRERFRDWDPNCFGTFPNEDFERFYPDKFKDRVEEVLSIEDKQRRRQEKMRLLQEVIVWIEDDRERAREAFATSARQVVDLLKEIDKRLFP